MRLKLYFFLLKKSHFVLITITLLFIFFSCYGFDFTDEGLYAILTNPAQNNNFNILNYDIIFKYIYIYTNKIFDIIELRILRIILLFVGSVYFMSSVIQTLSFHAVRFFSKKLIIIVGLILAYWSYAPSFLQTPGYHFFHFLGLQFFLGSLFFFQIPQISSKVLNVFLLSLVCFLGFCLCLLSKISSFPFLIVILILQFSIFNKETYAYYILFLLLLVLFFFILSKYSLFASRINPESFIKVLAYLNQKNSTHSIKVLSIQFAKDLLLFSLIAILGIWFSINSTYLKSKRLLFSFATIIFMLIIVDLSRSFLSYGKRENFFSQYLSFRFCVSMIILVAFITGYSIKRYSFYLHPPKNILNLITCYLLSIAYVFGSNSSNLFIGVATLQFFYVGLLFIISKKLQVHICNFVVIVTLFFFTWNFSFGNPDRQRPFYEQSKKFYYGPKVSSFIYLDSSSYNTQMKLKEIIRSNVSGNLIGYTRMLGHVYLCGINQTYPGSYLWGEEDLEIYFNRRFTNTKSFILILESKNQIRKLRPFLSNYIVEIKDSVYINQAIRSDHQLFIYHCYKNNLY